MVLFNNIIKKSKKYITVNKEIPNDQNHEYIMKNLNNIKKESKNYNLKELHPDYNTGEFSDGYHTFNELYDHRAKLFAVICNSNKNLAWKSLKHDTGDMYDGMFIVGINTPEGQATYHYDIEPYWDLFDVKELDKAPKWDGHTPNDAINRILSLSKL